jgi:hypothetical protein
MKLTTDQIKGLANGKGVRRIAVENFLISLGQERNALEATLNLHADAKSYGWNAVTIAAIKKGIRLFYEVR